MSGFKLSTAFYPACFFVRSLHVQLLFVDVESACLLAILSDLSYLVPCPLVPHSLF